MPVDNQAICTQSLCPPAGLSKGDVMSQAAEDTAFLFEHAGRCPICERDVTFVANGPYFRNTLRCSVCRSAPRNRALMQVLSRHVPGWRELAIHEGSPGWDSFSKRLLGECAGYIASQFDEAVPFGSLVEAPALPCGRYRSENLEHQTFADESFDVVVTQDVFEHVYRPDLAIREIARTLRPGGAALMTVPIIRRGQASRRRASLQRDTITHHLPPEYHGNPIGKEGSLVTIDWGYDIVTYLQKHSGLCFMMVAIDDIDLGIRADLNEVLVGFKVPMPDLSPQVSQSADSGPEPT